MIYNVSSLWGSSDNDSKLGEDFDQHDFFDNEQDLEFEYWRVLQNSICMSKINEKGY